MFTEKEFLKMKRFGQVRRLSPSDFEWFGKYLLESLGYQSVQVTEKKGELNSDGGIDLTGTLNGERFYGECKRWSRGFRGDILPIAIVRSLGGAMMRDGIKRGVVVTTLRADHTCISEGGRMGIGILGADQIVAAMKNVNPRFTEWKPGPISKILNAIIGSLWYFFVGSGERTRPSRARRRR